MIKFRVPGKPQGKGRPRIERNPYTGKIHGRTPDKTVEYENFIRWCYKAAKGKHFGVNTLAVDVQAYFPIPKSVSQKKRAEILNKGIKPTVKPDCDNIIKAVLDALNKVAYDDDKQVVSISCTKHYAENGYLEITITEY